MDIESILKQVQSGAISIENAKAMITSYEDIGYAKIDHNRQSRTGFPEVIYGEGKTSEQIKQITERLMETNRRLLATRINPNQANEVVSKFNEITYNETARTLTWKHQDEPQVIYEGYIAVVCAGTSDLPVAEEAAITAETFGCQVKRVYDVGVAGIHRLFNNLDTIKNATVTIVVAGMEGALASVVGGLIHNPIIAVPTSVGYGSNFQGLSALLTMLNSCASGVSVVNIDNGFGAGYNAALINQAITKNIEDKDI